VSAPLVHVVDDDAPLREGIARLLRAEGYEVRTYASGGDFLLAPPEPRHGCILLDLQMPGPGGLELQEALRRHPAALPVVFVTGHGDIEASVRAMKAGAVDFLTKPVQPEELLRAVAEALARDRAARERRGELESVRARFAKLTERERAVMAHVAGGGRNKVIARALGITERTVKMHRAQVMAKMQAASLAELVQMARLLGELATEASPGS
jgi:FixJ family two-component response regulator